MLDPRRWRRKLSADDEGFWDSTDVQEEGFIRAALDGGSGSEPDEWTYNDSRRAALAFLILTILCGLGIIYLGVTW